MEKAAQYVKVDGSDLIDKWAREKTPTEFRAIMGAHIEKINTRVGKMELIVDDVRMLNDYSARWLEYEQERRQHG